MVILFYIWGTLGYSSKLVARLGGAGDSTSSFLAEAAGLPVNGTGLGPQARCTQGAEAGTTRGRASHFSHPAPRD
jgi:hypothetical protein